MTLSGSGGESPAPPTADLHPLLEEAFEALERQGVRWCLLRGETLLQRPDDVDLLIAQPHGAVARAILENLGFVHLPAWGRGPHLFFLAYHQDTGSFVRLDVVTELCFGAMQELESDLGQPCLARRRSSGGLAVLDADDAMWTLLLHCLVDKGHFAAHHRASLQRLVSEADGTGPARRIVATFSPPGWTTARVVESLRLGRWETLESLGRPISEAWARRQWPAAQRRRAVNRMLRVCTRALLVPRRGVSVALLAPDGGGKSTLAAGLEGTFPGPVRSIYMGLTKASGSKTRYRVKAFGTARILRQYRRYLTGRYHRSRGRLVVFDRYIYDAMLPPSRQLSAIKRIRRRLLSRLCPAPDLVLLLDAPAEILYRRSREHSVAVLEGRRRDYLTLQGRVPNLRVVDASGEQERVLQEATSLIWEVYRRRIKKR
jgi:thymidylate kinase